MLENKLQMAAVVSTTTCFGLGARAEAEGAAMPRSVCSTTMLCRQVHTDQALQRSDGRALFEDEIESDALTNADSKLPSAPSSRLPKSWRSILTLIAVSWHESSYVWTSF